ncbi:glycosyltransferase family 4 protein, partial [Candidatus Microgenomates bacterium]|nr:glycosyltransferase family 4 protein [Candidatus Microgenomates bacterium]
IKKDVDIIFPTNNLLQSVFVRIWSVVTKTKMVVSGQSGLGFDDRINMWVFPDAFVALTEHQKKWAQANNPLVEIFVIPNGVDLKDFKSNIKAYNFNLPRPIVLDVSALTFWKRQELAIKAVAKLDNGSLLLVGMGEDESKLRKIGENLLPGRFKILSVNHNEMPSIYASSDLFTFPTIPAESFGIVLVEAMAAGLPVVATNDPIRKEIVGNAGLLVDPENTKNYADAISQALTVNWGDKPRKQAEKFSWDKIAIEYKKLFENLVK